MQNRALGGLVWIPNSQPLNPGTKQNCKWQLSLCINGLKFLWIWSKWRFISLRPFQVLRDPSQHVCKGVFGQEQTNCSPGPARGGWPMYNNMLISFGSKLIVEHPCVKKNEAYQQLPKRKHYPHPEVKLRI